MQNIYDRQKALELSIPHSVLVIGVGGIGSWVALNLALVGVKQLALVDPDKIEPHNLNRTPFRLSDIGRPKVDALVDLILERRVDINIEPYQNKIEDLIALDYIDVNLFDYIIDCRDRFNPLEVEKKNYVKLGYDGKALTLHFNPSPQSAWGEGAGGYEVIPSYLVPPQLLAGLITEIITSSKFPDEEVIINLTTEDIVKFLFDRAGKLV